MSKELKKFAGDVYRIRNPVTRELIKQQILDYFKVKTMNYELTKFNELYDRNSKRKDNSST